METNVLLHKPLKNILLDRPFLNDFFLSFNMKVEEEEKSFIQLVDTMPNSFWEENGTSGNEIIGLFVNFIDGLENTEEKSVIKSLDVIAGVNKSGEAENCNLHLVPGEITCIVGPTGSGKSRLLADIEWLANEDTPTKRKILVNNQTVDDDLTAQYGGKLIAQITQNMNFVLDMTVHEFLMLHAQSRLLSNAEQVVKEVIDLANDLSGEQFDTNTPVTFLSGGQSRALMIADVACIGQSPIVLIDEIENAGVNKKKAMDLLVSKDKIVLMATHDPLLILLADKRVVIKNGGIDKIITTNSVEKYFYRQLQELDNTLQKTKDFFRHGKELEDVEELMSKI